MTLRSVKVFMYVAKNSGVQSTERTDFMNELLHLLHVHYTRGSKLQGVIIRVILSVFDHMPDYQPLRRYENFNVCT